MAAIKMAIKIIVFRIYLTTPYNNHNPIDFGKQPSVSRQYLVYIITELCSALNFVVSLLEVKRIFFQIRTFADNHAFNIYFFQSLKKFGIAKIGLS